MLTEAQAIKECQELWAEIAKSGFQKGKFLRTESGKKWAIKGYPADCPLCQYMKNTLGWGDLCGRCPHCPLVLQFGQGCYELEYDEDPQRFNYMVQKLRTPEGAKC